MGCESPVCVSVRSEGTTYLYTRFKSARLHMYSVKIVQLYMTRVFKFFFLVLSSPSVSRRAFLKKFDYRSFSAGYVYIYGLEKRVLGIYVKGNDLAPHE